jgi:RNA-binding protein YhbY
MTKEQKMDLILKLLNKDDSVKVPMLSNKKETKKEYDQRMINEVCENAIKHRNLRDFNRKLKS